MEVLVDVLFNFVISDSKIESSVTKQSRSNIKDNTISLMKAFKSFTERTLPGFLWRHVIDYLYNLGVVRKGMKAMPELLCVISHQVIKDRMMQQHVILDYQIDNLQDLIAHDRLNWKHVLMNYKQPITHNSQVTWDSAQGYYNEVVFGNLTWLVTADIIVKDHFRFGRGKAMIIGVNLDKPYTIRVSTSGIQPNHIIMTGANITMANMTTNSKVKVSSPSKHSSTSYLNITNCIINHKLTIDSDMQATLTHNTLNHGIVIDDFKVKSSNRWRSRDVIIDHCKFNQCTIAVFLKNDRLYTSFEYYKMVTISNCAIISNQEMIPRMMPGIIKSRFIMDKIGEIAIIAHNNIVTGVDCIIDSRGGKILFYNNELSSSRCFIKALSYTTGLCPPVRVYSRGNKFNECTVLDDHNISIWTDWATDDCRFTMTDLHPNMAKLLQTLETNANVIESQLDKTETPI